MNHSERFRALFRNEPVDRVPLYYFGTWPETKERWVKEGLTGDIDMISHAGPQVPGMDPEWEHDMWGVHGLANAYLMGDVQPAVLEENKDYIIKRNFVGDIYMESKNGSSIDHTLEYALKPTWESWSNYKRFLDPEDPRRRIAGWQQKAGELMSRDMVRAFCGGSLYGWLRNWMGIENISCLMYDDPELLEEMVSHIVDLQMEAIGPVLKEVEFDFVYFFEDCCGATGPLFSPAIYKNILDKYYKKLITFYKDNNVRFALVDSDGKVDEFIPLWMKSGFDIIFPIEVGTWKATPADLRKKFGNSLKMMGAVDKHVISQGEKAIYEHLKELEPEVRKGGFLPMPDHRIPPSVSYRDMQAYVRIFNEIFHG